MGCVSSSLLTQEDELSQLGRSSALGHHIVKLTSTTYGLLSLDPTPSPPSPSSTGAAVTPMTPPQRFTFGSIFPSPLTEPKPLWSEPRLIRSEPEVINSWELMSGLDTDSFRLSPIVKTDVSNRFNKENSNPNFKKSNPLKPSKDDVLRPISPVSLLDTFEKLCPPNGENRVVIYTTSLRGVRRTFEDCNAVRAAIEGFGVTICERDVSMDRGFKDELRDLMMRTTGLDRNPKNPISTVPLPRVFVKGRHIGGAEEVLKMVEEGAFVELLNGLPRKAARGGACEGCGGVGFLPCFGCNGSCKVVEGKGNGSVVVRCADCNENGLVLCPICS